MLALNFSRSGFVPSSSSLPYGSVTDRMSFTLSLLFTKLSEKWILNGASGDVVITPFSSPSTDGFGGGSNLPQLPSSRASKIGIHERLEIIGSLRIRKSCGPARGRCEWLDDFRRRRRRPGTGSRLPDRIGNGRGTSTESGHRARFHKNARVFRR